MRYYRNGYAVIWMGANGGYVSHNDFVNKVNSMVEYGNYDNYLVILAREFAEEWVRAIMELLTDEDGFCHVIYLMDTLPYRGYAMAGISNNDIDTSNWVTTDLIKKNAPLLCDYNASLPNDEDKYGGLHFSAWGYKAIAKLVEEKLMALIAVGSSGGGDGGGNTPTPTPTTGTDDYGHYVYKLSAPRTFNGKNYLNTKIKLYEDVTADWTFVCKYSGEVICDDGYPANIYCCTHDGSNDGIMLRFTSEYSPSATIGPASFGLGPIYDNHTYINYDSPNVIIIIKSGNSYKFFCNDATCAYGGAQIWALTSEDAHELPLIFGGRWSTNGQEVQYKTKFTLEDARIYDEALDESDAIDLYYELTGSEE